MKGSLRLVPFLTMVWSNIMNQPATFAAGTHDAGLEADVFEAARNLFRAQKADLRALAIALASAPVSRADADNLARLTHNIAGTASYFGNADLGRHAVAIEHQLRTALFDEARQGACLALLDALDRIGMD